MNAGVDFYIQQQVRRYQADLTSWASRVRHQRHIAHALQIAANPPVLSGAAQVARSIVSSDKRRAEQAVERTLEELIDELDDSEIRKQTRLLRQALAGRYPTLMHKASQRLQRINHDT